MNLIQNKGKSKNHWPVQNSRQKHQLKQNTLAALDGDIYSK